GPSAGPAMAGLRRAPGPTERYEDSPARGLRALGKTARLELLVRGRDPPLDAVPEFVLRGRRVGISLGPVRGDEFLGLFVGLDRGPFLFLGGGQKVGIGRPSPVLVFGKLSQRERGDRGAGDEQCEFLHGSSSSIRFYKNNRGPRTLFLDHPVILRSEASFVILGGEATKDLLFSRRTASADS